MEVLDVRNKEINVGFPARYLRTGTTGEVSEMKSENDSFWIKFKDSDLWYNVDSIEVLKLGEYKSEGDLKKDTENMIEKMKDMENIISNFDNSDEDSCGAG